MRQKYLENLCLKSSDKEINPLPPEVQEQLLCACDVEGETWLGKAHSSPAAEEHRLQ